MENPSKERAKRRLATFSLAVSFFLVFIKIAAAWFSNSLGLYSEALNNGLDIVTVLITFLAIRLATRPPDKDHPYGHGRYENLSALAQILIISLLSFYILYESVQRILTRDFEIRITWHLFLVLALSIALNIVRVVYLGIIAKKYDSVAFKADFVNYAGDIFSSAVVLSGLAFARIGLFIADPIASMIVSVAILFFGLRLAIKTLRDLIGYIPEALTDKVTSLLEERTDIDHIHSIRIHEVSNIKFINIAISLKGSLHLFDVERIKEKIRHSITRQIDDAEVFIDASSKARPDSTEDAIREITAGIDGIKDIHNVFPYKVNEKLNLSIHLELQKHVSLSEAETITDLLEQNIKSRLDHVQKVYIHIEDEADAQDWEDITGTSKELIVQIKEAVSPFIDASTCHRFTILSRNHKYILSFHCYLPQEIKVSCAHRITSAMEKALRGKIENIAEVTIHAEPMKTGS